MNIGDKAPDFVLKDQNDREVRLSDEWSNREMQIVVRNLESLPSFARELVELLVEDGTASDDASGPDHDIPTSN